MSAGQLVTPNPVKVLEVARGLTAEQRDDTQRHYWRRATRWPTARTHSKATKRVHKAYPTPPLDSAAYALVDEACGISGAAADAVLATLARDAISAEDYDELTRVWLSYFGNDSVKAGLA